MVQNALKHRFLLFFFGYFIYFEIQQILMTDGTEGAAASGNQGDKAPNQQGQQNQDSNNKGKEVVQYSKEELDKLIQSEGDRRVSEALKTAKKKWETDYSARIEREREEAARISQMSEKERQEHLLKEREKELARKEQELTRKQLQLETIKILEERKLPTRFSKWLIGSDADSTFDNIKTFADEFNKAVEEELEHRMPRGTPRVGTTGQSNDPGRVFDTMIRDAARR